MIRDQVHAHFGTAADELIQHLRDENYRLRTKVNELIDSARYLFLTILLIIVLIR